MASTDSPCSIILVEDSCDNDPPSSPPSPLVAAYAITTEVECHSFVPEIQVISNERAHPCVLAINSAEAGNFSRNNSTLEGEDTIQEDILSAVSPVLSLLSMSTNSSCSGSSTGSSSGCTVASISPIRSLLHNYIDIVALKICV